MLLALVKLKIESLFRLLFLPKTILELVSIELPVLGDPSFLNLKAEGHNQFPAPRNIHRTPVVVQALLVQTQTLVVGPHPHNSVTNIDYSITTAAAPAYPYNAGFVRVS
ncbi:hypothetical protein QL285_050293 [Trifolium repens]|nr:hypothetical protein QL285_050293 [Trifolium repens]